MDLTNKSAIVTGGGTGVGAATAKLLAAAGCAVVVNYRGSQNEAEAIAGAIQAAGGKAIAVRADVSVDAEARALVDAAVAAFGRLDVLVNSAGTTAFVPAGELDGLTDEIWDRLMRVNVVGPFHCIRAAAAAMRASGGGSIVNVSSIAGQTASGSSIAYCASKAALDNLTVALARELGPTIRVNGVAPGPITGRWLREGLGDRYDEVIEAWGKAVPLGRVCDPEDVAAAIVSLITGSELVTGQILNVDGGTTIAPTVRL